MLIVLAIKRNIASGLGRTRFTREKKKADTLRSIHPAPMPCRNEFTPGSRITILCCLLDPTNLHQCRFLTVPGFLGRRERERKQLKKISSLEFFVPTCTEFLYVDLHDWQAARLLQRRAARGD